MDKVSAGDLEFRKGDKVSAAKLNALVGLASGERDYRKTGASLVTDNRDGAVVLVKNAGDVELPRFGGVVLTTPVITTADNEKQFISRPAFYVRTANDTDKLSRAWAILIDPLQVGGMGLAVISGLAICKASVTDTTLDHLSLVPNSVIPVTSSSGYPLIGTYSTTGEQLVAVQVGSGGGEMPLGEYQYMVFQNVSQNQVGFDWLRAHPPI